MSANILVITADIPFGEFIRQNLMETGGFHVCVTKEQKRSISFLLETNCTLAFVDTAQDEQVLVALCRRLRETRPGLRFVLFADPDRQSILDEFSPEGCLSKPFYMPDLLALIDKSLPGAQPAQAESNPETKDGKLAWLADVTRAAQHLTRLTLASSAQAALITSHDQLWAYAGQLPELAAHELAKTVTRYWDKAEENDLVRFVRLDSTSAEHMLYATRLASGMVLALVFDAETPFSTIRAQASQLVRSLSVASLEEETATEPSMPELASFSEILANVPPPNPSKAESGVEQETSEQITAQPEHQSTRRFFPFRHVRREPGPGASAPASVNFSRETSPAVQLNSLHPDEELEVTRPHLALSPKDDLEVTVKSRATRKNDPSSTPPENPAQDPPEPLGETRRKILLEPVSPNVYNLDYACLLIPRFIEHHLTGDLSERLGEWVQQSCIAFGWRLEYISVRPDYLQWIVNVPPVTAPSYLMRIMRQQTSEKIFAEFPRFSKENPSGDFWAPGYLIMGGGQPPPITLIKEYIAQIRQRQGINRPLPR